MGNIKGAFVYYMYAAQGVSLATNSLPPIGLLPHQSPLSAQCRRILAEQHPKTNTSCSCSMLNSPTQTNDLVITKLVDPAVGIGFRKQG